jgi:hypothetical protein
MSVIYFDGDDFGGEPRRLGTLEQPAASLKHEWVEFGSQGIAPGRLIPMDDWRPVDYSGYFPTIHNQGSVGQCNAEATINVVEGLRRMSGFKHSDLSPGDLYGRINGGLDNGSLPEHALAELMKNGVATTRESPHIWDGRRYPDAAAARTENRILEALWCPTGNHVASALQQGWLVDIGVWWYGSDPLDSDGWMQHAGSRGRGGHAICCVGLVNRRGQWGIKFVNSWSDRWGQRGLGVMPLSRAHEGCQVFQAWACRQPTRHPGRLPKPQFETPEPAAA